MTSEIIPKVSVCITAYNHRNFIVQTLESVLAQQTEFPIEIIVGEDGSDDGTREIVRDFEKRHPNRMRPLYNDRKDVSYFNGKPSGLRNFTNNLNQAHGQYIALLDGDDYWTDAHKLQKQVDALDASPECSFSFHKSGVMNCETGQIVTEMPGQEMKQFVSLEEILSGFFISTCSVVFRRGIFGAFPKWYSEVPVGDWPLYVLIALHGPARYLDDRMSVYRIHDSSYWSSRSRTVKLSESMSTVRIARQNLPEHCYPALDENLYSISKHLFHAALREFRLILGFRSFLFMMKHRGDRKAWTVIWDYIKRAVGLMRPAR